MNYFQIIKYEMTNLTLDGRASKKEYLYYKIFRFLFGIISIICIFLPLIILFAGYKKFIPMPMWLMIFVGIILFLIVTVLSFLGFWFIIADACIAVRRLHDFEYSGWYYLVFFAICFIAQSIFKENLPVMVLLSVGCCLVEFCIGVFVNGTEGSNEYGEKSSL
ncbi:MAG: DUF805 domain-containing protein [Candidatus Gastranaerophilales bacterium]|nr:DUF805 domain-containing protein [Candidatus Gastranaerophilales bacterium]